MTLIIEAGGLWLIRLLFFFWGGDWFKEVIIGVCEVALETEHKQKVVFSQHTAEGQWLPEH